MTWTPEKKKQAISDILSHIESGKSVRSLLDKADRSVLPSNRVFLEWVEEDEELRKQYTRAREVREEIIFEEILEIADKQGEDVTETEDGIIVNHNVINRNRLQIDARKWMLGKMNSKKYGERIQQDIVADVKVEDAIDYSKLPKEVLSAIAAARK